MYGFGLADAMDARHGLQVGLGVPVRIEEDARVRRLEVDAQASRSRRHEEEEDRTIGSVERLDVDRALDSIGTTVQSRELVAPEP